VGPTYVSIVSLRCFECDLPHFDFEFSELTEYLVNFLVVLALNFLCELETNIPYDCFNLSLDSFQVVYQNLVLLVVSVLRPL